MSAPAVRRVPIDQLALYDDNVRVHGDVSIDALCKSLEKFGQPEPLVCRHDGVVIAGNGRLEAMRRLGWTHAQVRYVDWDDAKCQAYSLVANRTAELSTWDMDAMQAQVDALRVDFDLDDLGFDAQALDGLDAGDDAAPVDAEEPHEVIEPETPDLPTKAVTNVGDVWTLGRHTLYCGDCLSVMGMLPDKSIDMVFADLPYGVTANAWDTPLDLPLLWQAWERLSHNSLVVLTGIQPFSTTLITSQKRLFKYEIIWQKNRPTAQFHAKHKPLNSHEGIYVFYKSKGVYNPQMTLRDKAVTVQNHGPASSNYAEPNRKDWIGKFTTYTHKYPTTVVSFDRVERAQHPTQKPVPLLDWLVRTYTNAKSCVLDPTAGCGTTLLACEQSDRTNVSIELSPAYCDIIVHRWEALTGQKAVRQEAAA